MMVLEGFFFRFEVLRGREDKEEGQMVERERERRQGIRLHCYIYIVLTVGRV